MPGIAIGNCIPFNRGGVSWSSYWTPQKEPSNLIVTAMADTTIDFSWTAAAELEDGYKLKISTDGVTYTDKATVDNTTTTVQATGLTAGVLYYFKVVAYKGTQESVGTDVYDTRFKITVDTTKAGSAADTFILPNYTSGTYDYYVDWGEGGAEEHITTAGNHSHTYAAAGTYQIMIRGTMPQIYFISGGDEAKLIFIDNWGNIKWNSFLNAFYGCINMNGRWVDCPNLTGVTTLRSMFINCPIFNYSLYNFNTSSIKYFETMLRLCTSFKQSLASFSIASAIELNNILYQANINETGTTTNYDETLISWAAQDPPNSLKTNFGTSKYGEGLVDSGTTDGVAANKLIQSGQNFLTTVTVGDVIYNTTDGTYALVTAIDSDTQLSISADIMASGEVYRIQHSDAAKARAKLILTDLWTITDGGYL